MQLREFTQVLGYPKNMTAIETQSIVIQTKAQNTVIHQFPFIIGSQKSNHLVIQDDYISRKHCQIIKKEDNFYLEDLKSTNGTSLNGSKIEKEKLSSYNSIAIGKTQFIILIKNSKQKIKSYSHNSFHGVITQSPKMFKIFTLMRKFAPLEEPIAIIGNSGEQTTGAHLHFELWYNGNPIDPQDYMVF